MPKPSKNTDKPKASSKPADTRPAPTSAAKPDPEGVKSSRPAPKAGGLVDTGVAASAASMLLALRKGRNQIDASGGIKQIKSDLNKPASAVAGGVLDQQGQSSGTHRPGLPGAGQAPHSQTVGHAAERTYVPRRTGG